MSEQEQEFKKVFTRLYKGLFYYFHKRMPAVDSRDKATTSDDLVQLTLILSWQRRCSTKYETYTTSTIFWFAAREVKKKYLKIQKRRISIAPLEERIYIGSNADRPDFELIDVELVKEVYESMRDADKELFGMLWAGLSYTEMSEILLISNEALRTRVCRLRDRIHGKLNK